MIIAPVETPVILASNVPQVEVYVLVWNSTDTYLLGDEVQVNGSVNKKYKASQNVPAGVDPSVDADKDSGVGTYWVYIEATNYAKPFEVLNSSVATQADSISYTFAMSDIDVMLLTSLHAKTVQVIVTNLDNGVVVSDETYTTWQREVYYWFDWTYAKEEYKTKLTVELPLIYNASVQVILSDVGNTVQIGHLVYGRSQDVGLTLANPAPTTTRRSLTSKSRDDFGNIITRKKIRFWQMSINCLIDSVSIDIIEDRLEKFVDTPCIIVGDFRTGGYETLSIFGEIKDHDMPIGISKTQYKLEVEGYL